MTRYFTKQLCTKGNIFVLIYMLPVGVAWRNDRDWQIDALKGNLEHMPCELPAGWIFFNWFWFRLKKEEPNQRNCDKNWKIIHKKPFKRWVFVNLLTNYSKSDQNNPHMQYNRNPIYCEHFIFQKKTLTKNKITASFIFNANWHLFVWPKTRESCKRKKKKNSNKRTWLLIVKKPFRIMTDLIAHCLAHFQSNWFDFKLIFYVFCHGRALPGRTSEWNKQ